MIIDLIRHGEPEGGRKYRGNRVDDPLSEKGWAQMWSAVGDYQDWDHIVSSPLIRCSHFAEQLSKKIKKPFSIVDNLKEVGFGTWEGKTPKEIQTQNQAEYDDFYRDPVNLRPAGAEPLDAFFQRVSSAIIDVEKKHRDEKILVVAHAGVVRAAITYAMSAHPKCMYQLKIGNAQISRIDQGNVIFVNRSNLQD